MSREAYYTEAVTETLLHMGIALTVEQIAELEESMSISCSNESMAFGHDCIPNPLQSELERVKRARSDDERQADARLREVEKELWYRIRQLEFRCSDLQRELDHARRAA